MKTALVLSAALTVSPRVQLAPSAPGLAPLTPTSFAPAFAPTLGSALAPSYLAASAPSPAAVPIEGEWRRGTFVSGDGTPLSYAYRPGAGPAILMVHGRGVGQEGFPREVFPGRALMFLERRGYGGPSGSVDESAIGEANARDIEAAIDELIGLSGGGKVGVVGYSLGALVLPKPDPAKVLWMALLCPGVPGMARLMPASTRATALAARQWYAGARWLGAWMKAPWLRNNARPLVLDLARRLREGGHRRAADALEARADDDAFLELFVQESLWAMSRDEGPGFEPAVPVFVGYGKRDPTVPLEAVRAHIAAMRAAGVKVRAFARDTGHLEALSDPALLFEPLERFDLAVRQ